MPKIRFSLNGKPVEVDTDGDRRLLWVLRTDFGLTGPKYGCGIGQCGACTVLVDGRAQRSCLLGLQDVAGKRVTTIEGLAPAGKLHPVQQAFVDHGAIQCGYCTPGMVLTAVDLLRRIPNPTEAQIRQGMEGNLCRCSAYNRIVQAIQAAAKQMRGSR